MKNLFYFLPCLLLSCSTPIDLSRAVFKTDPKISSKLSIDQEYSYVFKDGQYAITYIDIHAVPETMYKIEEGTYYTEQMHVVLSPTRKLFCSIYNASNYVNCIGIHPMDGARYVQRDTLSIALQTKLGFNSRRMPVVRSSDMTLLIDDAVSESALALQR